MDLTRTTLRLKTDLKKRAQKLALEENTSLQNIFNLAMESFLKEKAKKKAKRLVFYTHDLGAPLDNLTREDMYESP